MALHGVELVFVPGTETIQTAASSIIGLVGVSPDAPLGLQSITTQAGVDSLGLPTPTNTLRKSCDHIFQYGGAVVAAVNIYNAGTHLTAVVDESKQFADGVLQLNNAPVGATVITDVGGATTYVEGTDYTIDGYGNVRRLPSGSITAGETIEADYSWLDLSNVTASDVTDGLDLLDNAKQELGVVPRLLIAPWFSENPTVAAAMVTKATLDAFRAIAILDLKETLTVSDVLAVRAGGTNADMLSTTSNRAYFIYPRGKMFDVKTQTNVDTPQSGNIAGLINRRDNTEGYWNSPSNQPLLGVTGLSKTLSLSFTDVTAQNQQLNAAGVACYLNEGQIRLFGNATAAYPLGSTAPENRFISVRRTADIIADAIQAATLPFVDQNVTSATISDILLTINNFINTLINRGALNTLSTAVYNEQASNPATGNLVFDVTLDTFTPAELITIQVSVVTSGVAA